MAWLKAALGMLGSAYMKDAYVRPRQMGQLARDYCDRVRKPLLLIHRPGLVGSLVGAPVQAEYTLTQALPVRYPAKSFGAVFATGVLEREKHPAAVLAEWKRVADRVIVVVPSWWSPHAWLNVRNRWMIDPSLKQAAPLWDGRRHVHLLEVSDRPYARRPWSPKNSPQPKIMNPSHGPTESLRPSSPSPSPSPSLPSLPPKATDDNHSIYLAEESHFPTSDHLSMLSDDPNEPLPSQSRQSQSSHESGLSGLSNSVSHLTVLSAQDSDESW